MSVVNSKDKAKLISEPNQLLSDYHARIALYEMPDSVLSFYEENESRINGKVVFIRNKVDEANAAHHRNTCDKVFFIFSDKFHATSYFTGVSHKVNLPKALIKRVNNNKDW